MDLSKYNFQCQKAFHQGLQLARSYGHQSLEVEHVAFALLRDDPSLVGSKAEYYLSSLQTHLRRQSRVFGTERVGFGLRLDAALDDVEQQFGEQLVDSLGLWSALSKQSTTIKLATEKLAAESAPIADENFDRPQSKNHSEKTTESKISPTTNSSTKDTPSTKGHPEAKKVDDVLMKFTVDLSAKAERGELDPVIGRDGEVRRVLEILGRKKKNNPILVGEPGVGKSAVVEALALRIAAGQVPETVKGKRILSLDLGGILAGAKFRGEFEDRLKNLMKAMEKHKGQIILFIDELHMIVGAGNSEGGADAANLLKPALARGEIHCIGATTYDEYRKHIEKDSALERRFQPVTVDEPGRNATVAILRGIKANYEVHHGVQVDDDAIVAAVDLSIRYLPSRTLPDKAIDLLDEACSRLKLEIASMPSELDSLRGQIESLEIERKAISPGGKTQAIIAGIDVKLSKAREEFDQMNSVWRQHRTLLDRMTSIESKRQELNKLFEQSKASGDYDFAAKVQYSELPKFEGEIKQVQKDLDALQKQHHFLRQIVGRREVAEVVNVWSGVPVSKMLESDAARLMSMDARISARVFGQDKAVRSVCRAVRRARAGVNEPGRPLGVFMFIGPTGVGKTETARALASELFDDDSKIIRVDMSEYMQEHNVSRLIGAPPGYVGHGEGGELTEAVRRKPYSVVLFDEVEKAHPRVLDVLLQTFDAGRLTDGSGRVVDFSNTLIVLTSNLKLDVQVLSDGRETALRHALAEILRPEFVNRLDEVVEFRSLGVEHYSRLVDKQLAALNSRLEDRAVRIHVGRKLRARLVDLARDGRFGGRALKRSFETLVVDAVSEKIIQEPDKFTGAWELDCDDFGRISWRPGTGETPLLPAAKGL